MSSEVVPEPAPPVPRGPVSGFDTPRSSKDADLLDRWPFARSLLELATELPQEWSVRVGVYGEWGTGKSTVLNFVAEMAEARGLPVLRFNPWHHSDQDRLFEAFFLELAEVIAERIGRDPASLLEKVHDGASGLARFRDSTLPGPSRGNGEPSHGLVSVAKEQFRIKPKHIERLAERTGGMRLIVLVDDVDRASPEIVPTLLFALRELLDLPGFSFLVAFDPDRIVPVLNDYHGGFDGREFLEKIIDFPRWLPKPSAGHILRLALEERQTLAPFIPEEILRAQADLLPNNPRGVRLLFRQLRALASEVERHDDGELDPALLLYVELLRTGWPIFFDRLRTDDALFERWVVGPVYERPTRPLAERGDGGSSAALRDVVESRYERRELDRLLALLGRIGARVVGPADAPDFHYHSYLVERPHAMTHGEFGRLLSAWKQRREPGWLHAVVQERAAERETTVWRVVMELFDAALGRWQSAIERASEAVSVEERDRALEDVDASFALLRETLDDLDSLELTPPVPEAEQVLGLASVVRAFVRLEREPFASRVRSLRELLIELCRHPGLGPEVLLPAGSSDDATGGPELALAEEVTVLLTARLADSVLASLERPGGLRDLASRMAAPVWRFVVCQSTSPLWSGVHRDRLLQRCDNVSTETQANFVFLFSALTDDLAQGPNDNALTLDDEIRAGLWSAATRARLGARFMRHLDERRSKLTARGLDGLEVPAWWSIGPGEI